MTTVCYNALNEISKEYTPIHLYYNNSIDQDYQKRNWWVLKMLLTGTNLKTLRSRRFSSWGNLKTPTYRKWLHLLPVFTFQKRQKFNRQTFYLFLRPNRIGKLFCSQVASTPIKRKPTGNYEIFNLEYSEYIKTEFTTSNGIYPKEKIVAKWRTKCTKHYRQLRHGGWANGSSW
jgi:hypothetical protein